MMSKSHFEFTILSSQQHIDRSAFSLSASDMGLPENTPIHIEQQCLTGGKQQGSRLITLTVGDTTLRIVPTRAMAILDATRHGLRYGWDSPVREVVHPSFINLEASQGLGWLDGFNEMLVRCGYGWSGHPGLDKDELLTLHGRIQNTPADEVKLIVEKIPPYRVTLEGRVDEKRFKFIDFEVMTSLSLTPDEPYITVEDTLINLSSYSREYQVIYHNNFGPPILEPAAQLHIPIAELSPFNEYAAQGILDWNKISKPTAAFDEMVFNIKPLSDAEGFSYALLENAKQSNGIEVKFATDSLPVLTLWKNTDTLEQGYVVGIEPGTSFASNRVEQRKLGLVPTIGAKESKRFVVRFGLLTTKESVAASRDNIDKLQLQASPIIHNK